jgi:uroporphyrinogen-III synthase
MKFVFCVGIQKALELKENKENIKNCIATEIPTIEDVIVEVIEYYNTEESISHQQNLNT